MSDPDARGSDDGPRDVSGGAAAERPETDALSFEEAFERLEEIVERLEHGAAGLEESLRLFEEGMRLLRLCYQRLEHAEQRIELLTGLDDQGQPITVPFDATATAESQTPGRRPGTDVAGDAEDSPARPGSATTPRRSRRRKRSQTSGNETPDD